MAERVAEELIVVDLMYCIACMSFEQKIYLLKRKPIFLLSFEVNQLGFKKTNCLSKRKSDY